MKTLQLKTKVREVIIEDESGADIIHIRVGR